MVTNCNPVAAGSRVKGTYDGITKAIKIVLKALPKPINIPIGM